MEMQKMPANEENQAALSDTPVTQLFPNPYTALLQGQLLAEQGKKAEAIAALLVAFQHGSAVVRQRAIQEFKKLNEIQVI